MTQDPGPGQPGGYDPNQGYQQPGYDPNQPYQQPGYDPNQPYQQPGGYDPNQPYQQSGGYDPNQTYQQPGYGQPGYGQPGYPGYTQQQYPYPPASRGTNTMAILAIIFAFVFAPLGIVFGFIARNQIKQSGEEGAGLALAGIIIGAVFTALFVLFIVVWIVFFAALVSTVPNVSNFPTDITDIPFPTR